MADHPPPTQAQPETAPDPEEDDLDDLDDVLDSFQPQPPSTKPTPSTTTSAAAAPSSSGPGRPFGNDVPPLIDPGEEQLEKKLQEGMRGLVSELEGNPEMQKQFEQMMQELIAAGAAPSDAEAGQHLREAAEAVGQTLPGTAAATEAKPGAAGGKKGAAGGEDNFNETIRRTMERMQQSDQTASSSASKPSGASSEEEMLAQMMRELQAGGGGGGGEGGEEDFNAMLMNMMTQLTNKEILYEPMKELDEKFPGWMEKNGGGGSKVGKEDMQRFKEQQKLVGEIVGRFERKGYSDDNESDREYIVERMQKMQAAGSPPPDLVGDMSAAQEALGDLDAGCPTQ